MKEFPEALARVEIDPYSRTQSFFMHDMFPTREDGTCSCGCGKELTGRQTRWASKECSDAAVSFAWLVIGYSGTVRTFVERRDKGVCADCGRECGWDGEAFVQWEADHIVPVHQGGGGCTLDGYQTLCEDCHREKTTRNARLRAEKRSRDPAQLRIAEAP